MLRRGLALLSIVSAALVAVSVPAQAAVVEVPFGPYSIGDYCHASVNSSSWIGFYEAGGLRCYIGGPGGGLQYAGYGDPYLACKFLTTDVVMSAVRGPSDSLVCRVIR
jgi:hypothetical protein